ncbi:hypothetical protein GGQ60_004720 [Pedobacter zeae]|uniref:Uncharacterized protein n=1 Tax=Pedobacter zeae TaxID=1737356 RepID=A0A7W6KFD4_9SPHI|nr:hypothetical protein [Pedobacter zeae]
MVTSDTTENSSAAFYLGKQDGIVKLTDYRDIFD